MHLDRAADVVVDGLAVLSPCPGSTLPDGVERRVHTYEERPESLGIMTIAANRDPEVFTDPDRFDIRRSDARHLAFGGGPHYCLGASLGRVVTHETIAAIARRWPDVTLVEAEPAWAPLERGFRNVLELRLATG